MRPFPFILALCLAAAGSARAETWRLLNWDRYGMLAIDAEHRHTTAQGRPAVAVLDLALAPGNDKVEAWISEQEVDCADQRVRQRNSQAYYEGEKLGFDEEIQVWRDPGEERDRLLVRAVCRPDGLEDAPAVRADQVTEATAAQLAATTAPQTLDATPAWAAAWRTFSARNVTDSAAYIEAASRQERRLLVIAIASDGGIFLLADGFQKVAEQRYRFNAAYVGPGSEPRASAVWSLWEADCGLQRTRRLAWAGFDAAGNKTYAHDTNGLGNPFELAPPNSMQEGLLANVCATAEERNRKISVTADLKGAITAYQFYFYGRGKRPDPPGRAGWREAYLQACSEGCLPKLH